MNLPTLLDTERAVNAISAAHLICDLELNVLSVNKSAAKFFGLDIATIKNQNLASFLDASEYSDFINSLVKTASDGMQREVIQDSGLDQITKLKIARFGEVLSIELSDLTEVYRIQQRERVEVSRNLAILESINNAIIAIDFLDQTILPNLSSLELFGDISIARQELFGIFSNADLPSLNGEHSNSGQRSDWNEQQSELILAIKTVWQTGVMQVDYLNMTSDMGEALIIRKITRWDHDGKPRGIFISGTDVTNEVDYEDIKSRKEQLAQIQKFAQGIAHDFGNLSQSIHGFASLLSSKIEDADGLIILENLMISAERALAVSKKISEISRIQVLENVDFDIQELLERKIDLLSKVVGAKVDIDLIFEAPLNTNVRANPDQIERILENIIENANCAMNGSGKITVECFNDGDMTCLSIANTGPAIPRHIAEKMFMPFVTSRKESGTGLGLYLAYEYLGSCGGSIELINQNRNVVFKINLPNSVKVGIQHGN